MVLEVLEPNKLSCPCERFQKSSERGKELKIRRVGRRAAAVSWTSSFTNWALFWSLAESFVARVAIPSCPLCCQCNLGLCGLILHVQTSLTHIDWLYCERLKHWCSNLRWYHFLARCFSWFGADQKWEGPWELNMFCCIWGLCTGILWFPFKLGFKKVHEWVVSHSQTFNSLNPSFAV